MNELIRAHRAQVIQMEDIVSQMPQNGHERPLEHYFARKVYGRLLKTPGPCISVSKIHRFSQINALLKGKISVKTPAGVVTYEAPCVWVSPAGAKSITFYHEDTLWLSCHGTDETDLDKLEEEQICKTFEEFDAMEVT